jgi:hypothetical protein
MSRLQCSQSWQAPQHAQQYAPQQASRPSHLHLSIMQAVLHIPSTPSEMKEVLYERLSVPLQFLK